MFTGLVESIGTLRAFHDGDGVRQLFIETPALSGDVSLGESVAVNGCCLTVSGFEEGALHFDLLHETLARTNLGQLAPGSRVNLERALAANARLGGHFVQGHIDNTAAVLDVRELGPDLGLVFELPAGSAQYFVLKGSIAINGVSLTVATLEEDSFGVWIIPHTRAETNLGDLRPGERVNLEYDVLAKYAERILLHK